MRAIALLLFKFVKEFINLLPVVVTGEGIRAMVGVLTLVDVALVANLLIIIVFAGYENVVSKIDTGDHVDRSDWMGHVSFSDLKIKAIGSIVAISGYRTAEGLRQRRGLHQRAIGVEGRPAHGLRGFGRAVRIDGSAHQVF